MSWRESQDDRLCEVEHCPQVPRFDCACGREVCSAHWIESRGCCVVCAIETFERGGGGGGIASPPGAGYNSSGLKVMFSRTPEDQAELDRGLKSLARPGFIPSVASVGSVANNNTPTVQNSPSLGEIDCNDPEDVARSEGELKAIWASSANRGL